MPAGKPRSLTQLADEGAIERREVGRTQIERWLERSHRDMSLAGHASSVGDIERATTLVYEAGLRGCIVLLAIEGYRLRSGDGHHRAALEAATAIRGAELESTISRLDDARRFRNESLYGSSRPIGEKEFGRLTMDVQALLRLAARIADDSKRTLHRRQRR